MGKRILIADDSFGDRMVLRNYLLSFGYQIAGEARTGRESLEKYRDLKPDLICLDVAMPDMDGISAIRELRSHDPDVNVLVCVTRGQRAAALEAMLAGARDFVTKPLNPRLLRRAVKRMIG